MSESTPPLAVNDYEVKFILKPEAVLQSRGGGPKKRVRDALELDDKATGLAMQFLDNDRRRLHVCGNWNVRLRRSTDKDAKDLVELTYKKRYAAEDPGGVPGALAEAAADGFGRPGDPYECQVEWGHQKRTLTLSLKRTREAHGLSAADKKLSLPDPARSIAWALERMPEALRTDLRGRAPRVLGEAVVYGPVAGERFKGRSEGRKIVLEVWRLRQRDGTGLEPVVELSFKQEQAPGGDDDFAARLKASVDERGWLAGKDVLKTGLILERYG